MSEVNFDEDDQSDGHGERGAAVTHSLHQRNGERRRKAAEGLEEGMKEGMFRIFTLPRHRISRTSSAFISSGGRVFFTVRPRTSVSPRLVAAADGEISHSLARSLTRSLGVLTLQNANTAAWMTAAAAAFVWWRWHNLLQRD